MLVTLAVNYVKRIRFIAHWSALGTCISFSVIYNPIVNFYRHSYRIGYLCVTNNWITSTTISAIFNTVKSRISKTVVRKESRQIIGENNYQ